MLPEASICTLAIAFVVVDADSTMADAFVVPVMMGLPFESFAPVLVAPVVEVEPPLRLFRWGLPKFLGYCATCISGKAPPSSKSAMDRGTKRPCLRAFRSMGVRRENSAAAVHRCS